MDSMSFLTIITFIYFIPFINSWARSHKDAKAIFVLNLLLGWSGIFWILSLVWSFTGNKNGLTA